jgi:hypothetical protein
MRLSALEHQVSAIHLQLIQIAQLLQQQQQQQQRRSQNTGAYSNASPTGKPVTYLMFQENLCKFVLFRFACNCCDDELRIK